MTYAMEIHDSVLKELFCSSDGTGYAVFDAVVYRSDGQVFEDAQESGWQKLRFDFDGMKIEGEIGELGTNCYSGELWINGQNENGIISLPADHIGKLCLEMCVAQDARTLKVYAEKIRSSFVGEFEIETIWDAMGNTTPANA